jgi:hypothetical protein
MRATPSGLCLYAVVRAELARVLDAAAKKGVPAHHAYVAARGRRLLGDGLNMLASHGARRATMKHDPTLGAVRLGSARRTAQRRSERVELSGARRLDRNLVVA